MRGRGARRGEEKRRAGVEKKNKGGAAAGSSDEETTWFASRGQIRPVAAAECRVAFSPTQIGQGRVDDFRRQLAVSEERGRQPRCRREAFSVAEFAPSMSCRCRRVKGHGWVGGGRGNAHERRGVPPTNNLQPERSGGVNRRRAVPFSKNTNTRRRNRCFVYEARGGEGSTSAGPGG